MTGLSDTREPITKRTQSDLGSVSMLSCVCSPEGLLGFRPPRTQAAPLLPARGALGTRQVSHPEGQPPFESSCLGTGILWVTSSWSLFSRGDWVWGNKASFGPNLQGQCVKAKPPSRAPLNPQLQPHRGSCLSSPPNCGGRARSPTAPRGSWLSAQGRLEGRRSPDGQDWPHVRARVLCVCGAQAVGEPEEARLMSTRLLPCWRPQRIP